MILFWALVALAFAIAGATALAIFWPLMWVHIRDRHPQVREGFGEAAFASPAALAWVLRGGYRALGDRNLDGLATPARLSLLAIIGGLLMSLGLWGLAETMP